MKLLYNHNQQATDQQATDQQSTINDPFARDSMKLNLLGGGMGRKFRVADRCLTAARPLLARCLTALPRFVNHP